MDKKEERISRKRERHQKIRNHIGNNLQEFKYKNPLLWLLIIFFGLNFIIVTVAAFAICLSEGIGLWTSVVYVLTMMLMPDNLFRFEDGWTKSHFFQLGLMLCETIIFSGTIIGSVTNTFSRIVEKREKALGSIRFKDHIVILNWSSIGPDVLFDLSSSGKKYDVIILADEDRDEISASIESRFIREEKTHQMNMSRFIREKQKDISNFLGGEALEQKASNIRKRRHNLNVVIKQGNPNANRFLSEVSISEAKAVLILSKRHLENNDDFGNINDIDIISIKNLLNIVDWTNEDVNIVVEVDSVIAVRQMNRVIEAFNKDPKETIRRVESVIKYYGEKENSESKETDFDEFDRFRNGIFVQMNAILAKKNGQKPITTLDEIQQKLDALNTELEELKREEDGIGHFADAEIVLEKIKNAIDSCKRQEGFKEKNIIVFSYNESLGHMMGKILANHRYDPFFREVFSYEGAEFYGIPLKGFNDKKFFGTKLENCEDVLDHISNAIPVSEYDDNRNNHIDQIYTLSENDTFERKKSDLFTSPLVQLNLRSKEGRKSAKEKLVLICDGVPKKRDPITHEFLDTPISRKAEAIKEEIQNHNKQVLGNLDKSGNDYLTKPIECKIIQLGKTEEIKDYLKQYRDDPRKKKAIILSNEKSDLNSIDSNVIACLLLLSSAEESKSDQDKFETNIKGNCTRFYGFSVYAELLDPANYKATQFMGVPTTIVSHEYIALLASQFLTHKASKHFYFDLITTDTKANEGNFDVNIVRAGEEIDFEGKHELVFENKRHLVESFDRSLKFKKTILGYFLDTGGYEKMELLCSYECEKNQDKEKAKVVLKPQTYLIVCSKEES